MIPFPRYVNLQPGPGLSAFLRSILTITPKKRVTIAQIKAHPWFNVCVCLSVTHVCTHELILFVANRPSHVDRANPQALAERLTQNLRQTGDLSIAAPDPSTLGVSGGDMDIDPEEAAEQDDKMMNLTNATQFTRSLLLFVRARSVFPQDTRLTIVRTTPVPNPGRDKIHPSFNSVLCFDFANAIPAYFGGRPPGRWG
jgi:serine/threonine protein kinase